MHKKCINAYKFDTELGPFLMNILTVRDNDDMAVTWSAPLS